MMKWITPKIAVTFVISMMGYLLLLLLYSHYPVRPDSLFGRLFNTLMPLAPILIVAETIVQILKERARLNKEASQERGDQSQS